METLSTLQDWHAGEILIGVSILLVLIDYLFPTDIPCQIGYFCFAGGMFFLLPWGIGASLAAALVIWILLGLLHHFWLGKYLNNVEIPGGGSESPSES